MFRKTILMLVAMSAVVAVNAASTPIWRHLLIHDCAGGMHFMPSSPFAMHGDATHFNTIFKTVLDHITKRAKCHDTTITDTDTLCRWMPSVQMVLQSLEDKGSAADTGMALTNADDGFQRYSFFDRTMPVFRDYSKSPQGLALGSVPAGGGVDLSDVVPASCTYANYEANKPCGGQLDIQGLEIKAGILVQKCPNSPLPYMSLSCDGDLCKHMFKPCSSNGDCGTNGECVDTQLTKENILELLSGMGIISNASHPEYAQLGETLNEFAQCAMDVQGKHLSFPWRVVHKAATFVRSYFNENALNPGPAHLSLCLPKGSKDKGLDKVMEDAFEPIGDAFNTEGKQDLTQLSKYQACVAQGCNVEQVGDWVCDQACNNKACFWDGGDCNGNTALQQQRITGTQKRVVWKGGCYGDDCPYVSADPIPVGSGICVRTSGQIDVACTGKPQASCSGECFWKGFNSSSTCNTPSRDDDDPCKNKPWRIPPLLTGSSRTASSGSHSRGSRAFCGDGRCDKYWTEVCAKPWCDPTSSVWTTDNGEPRRRSVNGFKLFRRLMDEAQTCSQDCTPSGNCGTNGDSKCELREFHTQSPASMEFASRTRITWKDVNKKVILDWNGIFADGAKANDPLLMSGITYNAPGPDSLPSDGKGRTIFLAGCDGTIGFGLGNGLRMVGRIANLHAYVNEFAMITQNVQSCRSAINKLKLYSLEAFRAKWEFWQPEAWLYRLTSDKSGVKPTVPGATEDKILPKAFNFVPTAEETKDAKLVMPDSCSYTKYKSTGNCKVKFSGLKDLFETETVMFAEIARCSKYKEGLPALAIVGTGNVMTTASPLRDCDSNSDCGTDGSMTCTDINTLSNLNKILVNEQAELENSPGSSVAAGVYNQNQMLKDPLAMLVFGRRAGNSQCMLDDNTQKTIRAIIKRLGGGEDDGLASLKFCMPSFLTDFDKLTKNLQKFMPEICEEDQANPSKCAGLGPKRLSIDDNTKTITVRDLEKTEVSALAYGLDKITLTRGGKSASVKPDVGKVFQKLKLKLSKKVGVGLCKQKERLKRVAVRIMKKKKPRLFAYLQARHIVVACKTSTRRRLQAGGVTLDVSIQVPKEKAAETRTQITEALANKEALVATLADEGVVAADGTQLTVDDIEETTIEPTTSDTITVDAEDLPESIVAGKKEDNEKNGVIIPAEGIADDSSRPGPGAWFFAVMVTAFVANNWAL